MQICTLIHTNLGSHIPSLVLLSITTRETILRNSPQAVKRWYAQFLRRLGMDIKSVEVAKFLKSNPDEQEFRIGLRDPCESCSARVGVAR